MSVNMHYFFTLWGWHSTAGDAVHEAIKCGYDGIEGQVPESESEQNELLEALEKTGATFIQEIATTGSFVPDRGLSPSDHLEHLEQQLIAGEKFRPKFVTCLGGCDAWDLTTAIDFFTTALDIARGLNTEISFETHRGRPTFNPWSTQALCEAIPNLKLTFDISHWCVVCEGLQHSERELIRELAHRARHIHARVGYDQGPQVADPFQGVYQHDMSLHLDVWRDLIAAQQQSDQSAYISITPEFGVDGYQYRSIDGRSTLVEPRVLNHKMRDALQQHFAQATMQTAKQARKAVLIKEGV